MITPSTGWRRVTRNEPCPICGKPDWCGVSADGAAVRCMRVESDRVSNGGWVHRLGSEVAGVTVMRPVPVVMPRADLGELAQRWALDLGPSRLEPFADTLGIAIEGLVSLGIGWTGSAWSFPMRNVERRVVGIRLRAPDGSKFAVRGSKDGCFVPASRSQGPLLFPEGATDAAALLGLGFDVAGRPSCTGALRHCMQFGRGRDCVVVADDDAPGRRGAEQLAASLLPIAVSVKLVVPPAKDVRDWIRAGATRQDVEAWIGVAPVRRLRMREVTA